MKTLTGTYTLLIQPSTSSSSAPTAAMGWRAAWDTISSTMYTDAGTTQAVAGNSVYRLSEYLGVVANSYFDQATGGNRPVMRAGGAGGKNYLEFDGTSHFMESLAISNFFANNAKTLVVACTIPAGWANNDYIVGGVGGYLQVIINTGNIIALQNYDGSTDTGNTISFTDAVPLVISAKHDSGNLYIRKNGGAWDAGVSSGNTSVMTGAWRIASRGTNYVPLHFYGMAAANVVVSDSDLTLVENYYKSQLGI